MARDEDKSGKAERDAAAKAVTDNMAKLRAARLAREALAPPVVAKPKKKASSSTAAKPGAKSGSRAVGARVARVAVDDETWAAFRELCGTTL